MSSKNEEHWKKFIWTRISKKDQTEVSIPVWIKIDPKEKEINPKKLRRTAKKIGKDLMERMKEAESEKRKSAHKP